MKDIGWIFDIQIKNCNAVLWVKSASGKAVKLTDRYRPDFYAEPSGKVYAEELQQRILEHPYVYDVRVEKKHKSISSRRMFDVLHVWVDSTTRFRKVVGDIEGLEDIKAVYNTDLLHIQRYLFSKGFPPTGKVEFEYDGQFRLQSLNVLNDEAEVHPPPFKVLPFRIDVGSQTLTPNPSKDPVVRIQIYEGDLKSFKTFEGSEFELLSRFETEVKQANPDFLAAPQIEELTLLFLYERTKTLGLGLHLDRDGSAENRTVNGRVPIDLSDYLELGLRGLVEKSRFAMVPPRLAAGWPAGRTVDSRQCYDALRKDILIPNSKGFFKFICTAMDVALRDRGGLVLSPKVGLHENVAECDFESMFPHIIIRHNLSYETVTPNCVDRSRRGFLSELTEKFLARRLYFKHLRKRFQVGSLEWRCCEERQLALKMALVCIYGYSGCFANRFNNVTLYEEINRIARNILVEAIDIARTQGFEVIYADTDSIFIKKYHASKEDYENLASLISNQLGLPMALDRCYRYLVLLPQEADPDIEAARHYFGKLTSGELHYRGIELSRHDYPSFLKDFQEKLIQILFQGENADDVRGRCFKEAFHHAIQTYEMILEGNVDPRELVISKILRKRVDEYRSMLPHVCASIQMAEKGRKPQPGDPIDFIYVNAEHPNPLRRVMPAKLINHDHSRYDREKYGELLLDIAETVLRWNGFNRAKLGIQPKPRSFREEFQRERAKESMLELKNLKWGDCSG